MFLSPVIDTEVIDTVRSFKNKNSKDCHDMSMSLLKQIFSSVVKPILFTYVICLLLLVFFLTV